MSPFPVFSSPLSSRNINSQESGVFALGLASKGPKIQYCSTFACRMRFLLLNLPLTFQTKLINANLPKLLLHLVRRILP